MKKLTALLLAAILCLGMFVACTPAAPAESMAETPADTGEPAPADPPTQPAAPVTITVWHCADATIADTLQKQADALAPDIVVNFERKENLSETLKLVGNDPGSAPDLFMWAHDKVGVFAEIGILAPITDVIGLTELSDLLPMTLEAGKYGDDNYQLPIYYEALLFMYNKALLDAPPATTDALLEKMKAETTAEQYVFVEQHSTSYNSAAWIQGFGGYIINADKQPGLALQATKDALAYHKQFVPYMPADGEYNTVTTLFTEGKSLMTIGGPWLVPGLKDAGVDLGIAPMPTLPNGSPLKPFSGVQGVHVLKHAAESKKEAIAQLFRVLASPETGIALANAANCAPANAKAYENADVAANEMIMALKEMASNVVPMPNVPEMDVMWGVTDNLLASINKNNGDVASECDKYQKEAEDQVAAMQ